jgi:hypothetical protein
MTVSISDITASQQYINSLPVPGSANASGTAAHGGKSGGDPSFIPMLSIDDVFESNEAQTDAGESVKDFAKQLAAEFDITSHNVEELAFTTLRICDFPVASDPAHIPKLPMDSDIVQVIGIHPTEFKKLRENSTRSADAAGMHAYYDVLKRKGDISNLYNQKDFEWAEDDDSIPGTVSRWNELVEVSCVPCAPACSCFHFLATIFSRMTGAVVKRFKHSNTIRHNATPADKATSISSVTRLVIKTLLIR